MRGGGAVAEPTTMRRHWRQLGLVIHQCRPSVFRAHYLAAPQGLRAVAG